MVVNTKIQDFIERAQTRGTSEQSIIGMLEAQGWPEKEIYAAIASFYEQTTGLAVPRRKGTETPAKDAFFYLLIFSTLATWTIGLGALAFNLIDRWLADNLFSTPYDQGYDMYATAAAMAAVIVAFPIYLSVSRSVLRAETSHPEKLASGVRKWLTYMALVIAAGIFICDLITALTFFLRGEITSRFLAKASVVLLISSGVFFYYFAGVKKSEVAEPGSHPRRDTLFSGLASMVVIGMIVLGFFYIGPPSTQRTLRADRRRIQDVYQLSTRINTAWNSNEHQLPGHLDELSNVALADPITRSAYEYHVVEGTHYQLCATFAMSSAQNQAVVGSGVWSHPAGHYCFSLDAARTADYPNMYSPD
jgi:Domain of unknown function (DUF5671)